MEVISTGATKGRLLAWGISSQGLLLYGVQPTDCPGKFFNGVIYGSVSDGCAKDSFPCGMLEGVVQWEFLVPEPFPTFMDEFPRARLCLVNGKDFLIDPV